MKIFSVTGWFPHCIRGPDVVCRFSDQCVSVYVCEIKHGLVCITNWTCRKQVKQAINSHYNQQQQGVFRFPSPCLLLDQPTCCWTGALQRWHLWGQWATGWTAWEPCPARRPSLGSATAPATPWPRPPLSKTTTDNTHSKLPCLFTSGVFTGLQ